MLEQGTVICGRYRLIRSLDRGGMGLLWEATDEHLGHVVAIKFPSEEVRATEVLRKRFKRESRLAVRIGGPNVITILDEGDTEDGIPFIVMERLQGHDLDAHLEKYKKIDLFQAADIISQVDRVLNRAHGQGIIHRDLTPRNIFIITEVDGKLNIKVLDFGIAKDLDSGATSLTRTSVSMGSLRYMSPEQHQDMSRVSTSTDLWSRNVVLYEMLTGFPPFDSRTNDALEIIARVTQGQYKPATSLNPELPPTIDAYFKRTFAPKKEDRYSNVEEASVAFAEILRSATTVQQQPIPGGKPLNLAVRTDANINNITDVLPARVQPKRGPNVILLATAALLLLSVGAFWWRHEAQAEIDAEALRVKEAETTRIATETKERDDKAAEVRERERLAQIERDRVAEAERLRLERERKEREERERKERERREREERAERERREREAEIIRLAAWTPASEALRTELLGTIKKGDENERVAFRRVDASPLYGSFTGDELKHELTNIAELKKANRYMANDLIEQKFSAVEVQGNGLNARVTTTETWKTAMYDQDTQRCIGRLEARPLPQTIYLAKDNSRWRIRHIDHAPGAEEKWVACQ